MSRVRWKAVSMLLWLGCNSGPISDFPQLGVNDGLPTASSPDHPAMRGPDAGTVASASDGGVLSGWYQDAGVASRADGGAIIVVFDAGQSDDGGLPDAEVTDGAVPDADASEAAVAVGVSTGL